MPRWMALNAWVAQWRRRRWSQEFWPAGFSERDLSVISKRMRAEVPTEVLNWLRGLRAYYLSGGLLFVHAGINPAIDLHSFLNAPWLTPLRAFDESRHWAWVREPFLRHKPGATGFSGYFVVHGHTPRDAGCAPLVKDQIARFRLNLDAGSFYTGEAKLALIRGAGAEVWTAKGEPRL